MQFRQLKDPATQTVRTDAIEYTDDAGTAWTVPEGHRFWTLYQTWLAVGNTPLPPQ